MVASAKLYKKSSPNDKVTLYMGKREFVDTITNVEPVDGLVLVNDDYVRSNRKVFAQLVCHFRYGREQDETMGLNFHKELILSSQQVYPQQKIDMDLSKFQQNLMEKLGQNAFPFVLEMSPNSPASITLQRKIDDDSEPCGIQYYVKVFAGNSELEHSNQRSTVSMAIRKVQYAPEKQGLKPCTIVRKDFLLSPGQIELEVNLDKQLYHHGDKIAVNVEIRNNSNKYVKRIKASVKQNVDVLLFQSGQLRNCISSMETNEGCPIEPGSSLKRVIYLQPNLIPNQNRHGIAVEGNAKKRETSLASTTLVASPGNRDAFGIIVSYSVKVKLILCEVGGEVCAELPFVLMHPNPSAKKITQEGANVADEKLIQYE